MNNESFDLNEKGQVVCIDNHPELNQNQTQELKSTADEEMWHPQYYPASKSQQSQSQQSALSDEEIEKMAKEDMATAFYSSDTEHESIWQSGWVEGFKAALTNRQGWSDNDMFETANQFHGMPPLSRTVFNIWLTQYKTLINGK